MIENLSQPSSATDLITAAAINSFANSSSPRQKEVMQSLVTHLHAFIADVRLTESEWKMGVEFLTSVGQYCNDRRQEFIFLSDVLGASMLTVTLNHPSESDVTESTVLGPFFVENSPHVPLGGDISGGEAGEPCWVEGTVCSSTGDPVQGARIEVWGADQEGHYDIERQDDSLSNRGHLFSSEDGSFRFWAICPVAYPVPADGPVSKLLEVANRNTMRPAHLHFQISATGYRTLTTHLFEQGDPYLKADAVFGVRESLVTNFEKHSSQDTPDGRRLDSWTSITYNFRLAQATHPGG